MTKERHALGSGLSVLFGDDDLSSDSLLTLPISKIEPRQDQPRNYFDEEALQTLSESIAHHGVIQPITVRQLDSGYYQIIAGERRWRASRMAGLSEIPVRIIDADDKTAAELALVENLQREDLNPIEEALGYKSLIEEYNLSQEDAAKSVGKSRSAIANSMRLLNLSPEVISLVKNGNLSAGHARALIPISDSSVQLATAKKILSEELSVRETEKLISKLLKQPPKGKKEIQSKEIDYAKNLSDELSKFLGRKVTVVLGKKTGKIELEFYDADDREKLISTLKKLKK